MNRVAMIDGDVVCYQLAYREKDWEDCPEYVTACVDEFIQEILDVTEASSCEVFLTGSNNFRVQVAKHKPYKGNRQSEKPALYCLIKEHLLSKYNAQVSPDNEADDELGKVCTAKDLKVFPILCTVDKDLKMIYGLHYNWRKPDEGVTYVDYLKGDRFFFEQWMAGDATDNIAGASRIGMKTAAKLIEAALETSEQSGQTCYQTMYDVVVATYKSKGHSAEYMDEMAQLIWMQRTGEESYLTFLKNKGITLHDE
jgi:hypothetical protein